MSFEILKMVFMSTAAHVLPWLLGGLVFLGAVSISPLGRMLIGYLRERRRDGESLDALLAETSALRAVLGEVVERLDSTERHLAQHKVPTPPRNESVTRIPTPV
jgi:hypothetical protein